jgi:hypothetical protein
VLVPASADAERHHQPLQSCLKLHFRHRTQPFTFASASLPQRGHGSEVAPVDGVEPPSQVLETCLPPWLTGTLSPLPRLVRTTSARLRLLAVLAICANRTHRVAFLSTAPGWLTGFEPANTWFTARRSPRRASATPQRSKRLGPATGLEPARGSLQMSGAASRAPPERTGAAGENRTPACSLPKSWSAPDLQPQRTGAGTRARTGTVAAYEAASLPLDLRPRGAPDGT